MQTQERKSELLKYIKKELARFGEIQKKQRLVWDQRAERVHNLKHAIMCLTHGDEKVKEIDSWVGQKIMRYDRDCIEIVQVKRIQFEKWEIKFIGDGIRLYKSGQSCHCYGMDVHYEDFASPYNEDRKEDAVKLATDMAINQIVRGLEAKRNAEIAEYREKVMQEYGSIIEQITNNGTDPEKYKKDASEHSLCFRDTDQLYEETGVRMRDLVRWFGSNEDKIEMCANDQEPVDVCDDVVEPA
jgi:hypothetical protein